MVGCHCQGDEGHLHQFQDTQGQRKPLPTSQFMCCHMIFDVKMEDFQCKARLVAGGHMTKVLKTLTYLSVVSCETVQIALTIAMLNDLEVRPQMCKMHS